MIHAPVRPIARLHESMHSQRGSVLLEALIAILIFSMGILALIGMQAAAISNVSDAKYRSDASFLANQVIGEMWANQPNLASYAYAGTGTPPAVLTNWVAKVQSTLPGTAANAPTIAIGTNNLVTITVSWQPPKTPVAHRHQVITQINN
ncbi:MAG: type IV pilus modification protein PilV [Sulfuricella sp.]|nr:type IV pilus modification protein PilV [Sulfuricella sp.]